MPTHLGGEPIQTPSLARGSSVGRALFRKTSLLRDRTARRAVKRAIDLGCGVGCSSSLQTTMRIRSPLHDVRQPASRGSLRPDAIQNRLHGRAISQRDTIAWRSTAVSTQRLGGARRDRTDDLMLAKHALSQLSYGPGLERIRA